MTLAAGLLAAAARRPDRSALVVEDTRLTYAEVAARVQGVAAQLAAAGRPGTRVGLLLPPGSAFLEVFLGASLAGWTAVVLHGGWTPRELAAALSDARPTAVVTTAEALPSLARARWAGPTVVVPPDGPAGEALGALPAGGEARVPSGPAAVDDEPPFYLGFTSGSSGRPKGFLRRPDSWRRSFDAADVFGIGAHDEVAVPGPLDHSLSLFAALHGLHVGAGVHLQRRFAPGRLLADLAPAGVTRTWLVPSMLTAVVARATAADPARRFPTLATVLSSGARWPATLLEQARSVFPDARIVDFYGASELSFVSWRDVQPDDPPGSVGRPFADVEVVVRDGDGDAVPDGTPGTLWVRGPLVFDGYLGEDGRVAPPDAATWGTDGWVTVGDVVRRRADGVLQLLGRAGSMFIAGGVNVYPEELERVLEQLPGVLEVAVVGVPDPERGTVPCAVLRWGGADPPTRGWLRGAAVQHLPKHQRPRRWFLADELPRTPSGKVARSELADLVVAGALDPLELT